jgi:hypothetical protein
MKGITGPRPAAQVRGELPFSIVGANAQHRLAGGLKGIARNPGQMAKTLCDRIKPAGDGARTLNLVYLDEEETRCVQSMGPAAWRALHDFASAPGGSGLQSVVLGSDISIDDTIVQGLAELSEMMNLTLQPGPPIDEGLLLTLRAFNRVQITQWPRQGEAAADEPAQSAQDYAGAVNRSASPSVDTAPDAYTTAEVARDVLADALDDPDAVESARELPNVLNELLDEASQIPHGHVDKLLVGFLGKAVESGRGDLVDCYASTILDSPALTHDPGRRFALLMGLALPVSPSDWKPDCPARASDAFAIANVAAANLTRADRAAPAYRGPPLLNRMCREVHPRRLAAAVPPQQVALYHGLCALLVKVLESKILTLQEKKTFCASSFPGAGGLRTAAQFAVERGNLGMAVALMEIIIHADLPVDDKAALFEAMGATVDEVLGDLLAVKKRPDQKWVANVISWMEPVYIAQKLMEGDARVEPITTDPQLSALCAEADLRAVNGRLNSAGKAHEMVCTATRRIPGLEEVERPQGAGEESPDAYWYAIGLYNLRRRQ